MSCFKHKNAFPWIFPILFPICFPIIFMMIFGPFRMGWWQHPGHYQNQPQQQIETSQKTPLEALKMRYANGEITKEEYEQIKRDLIE